MPDLQFYLLSAESGQRSILLSQYKDAVTDGVVVCPTCGIRRALHMAFKCLYCGLWFCFGCAEKHFNQTVLEWRKEKRIALREELDGMTTEQIAERIRQRNLAAVKEVS